MMEIPVVDFEKCGIHHKLIEAEDDLNDIGCQIFKAFNSTGFVYLMNTGISSSDVDDVNSVTENFFKQPEDAKAKYHRKTNNFGYDALGKERLAAGIPGDYKESFNITGKAVEDQCIIWPDDLVAEFSSTTISFMRRCKCLALRIFDALSYGLDLKDKKQLSSYHHSILGLKNHSSLRCLCYPPVPAHLENGQLRLAEHTDYGCLTLLFQDHVGGLQIKTRDGQFIDAVPIKESVLVNVADLLQFWTKGRLKSTPHRILVPDKAEQRISVRRSIAFFVHPDEELSVCKQLMQGEEGEEYLKLRHFDMRQLDDMTVGEYVLAHFHNNYNRT